MAATFAARKDGGSLISDHRAVATAISDVVDALDPAVGKVDPVAALSIAAAVAALAVAEVCVTR